METPDLSQVMTLALDVGVWFLIGLCILGWGSIAFCWLLFGIAKYKGWSHPSITPNEILERLSTKERKDV